jgi:hypothetical protein
MKIITLRNSSQVAFVDDADFELVSMYLWDLYRKGYAYCRFWDKNTKNYKTVYMHRLIMNAPKSLQVDHRNRANKLDNRRQNLRLATRCQNQRNLWNNKAGKSSTFKGVSRFARDNRWQASIRVKGKSVHLELFDFEEDAAKAYNDAATEHFGEFALLNDICST